MAVARDSFEAELAAVALAAGLAMDDPRMLAFADLMINNTAVMVEILDAEIYAEMARALTADMSGVALEKALGLAQDKARIQAETLATNMTKSELTKMGGQLADGLKAGEGPRQIAKRLTAVSGLDGPRAKAYSDYVAYLESTGKSAAEIERLAEKEYQRLLRERRTTIARTEARHATSEARMSEAEARGAKVKSWVTTQDDRVSDECQANEAQGPIPIAKNFVGGVDMPPQHPNCRCSVAFGTSDLQQKMMKDRAEARAERTARAKETQERELVGAAEV